MRLDSLHCHDDFSSPKGDNGRKLAEKRNVVDVSVSMQLDSCKFKLGALVLESSISSLALFSM